MQKEGINNQANNFGLASVIFGIISLIFVLGLNLHGGIFALIGLIFAFIQRNKSNNNWAFWGIILNLAGIVINLAVFIWILTTITQQLKDSGLLDQLNQINELGNQQYAQ